MVSPFFQVPINDYEEHSQVNQIRQIGPLGESAVDLVVA